MSCCGRPDMSNFINLAEMGEREMICVGTPPDWQLLQQYIEAGLIEVVEVEMANGVHTAVRVKLI